MMRLLSRSGTTPLDSRPKGRGLAAITAARLRPHALA